MNWQPEPQIEMQIRTRGPVRTPGSAPVTRVRGGIRTRGAVAIETKPLAQLVGELRAKPRVRPAPWSSTAGMLRQRRCSSAILQYCWMGTAPSGWCQLRRRSPRNHRLLGLERWCWTPTVRWMHGPMPISWWIWCFSLLANRRRCASGTDGPKRWSLVPRPDKYQCCSKGHRTTCRESTPGPPLNQRCS
jgi:hypothetical protein